MGIDGCPGSFFGLLGACCCKLLTGMLRLFPHLTPYILLYPSDYDISPSGLKEVDGSPTDIGRQDNGTRMLGTLYKKQTSNFSTPAWRSSKITWRQSDWLVHQLRVPAARHWPVRQGHLFEEGNSAFQWPI